MFGRSRPMMFDSLGTRRSRGRVPPWLMWLLLGLVLGAAGVVLVQERYLPPRLSASESTTLRNAYDRAEDARRRLKTELDQAQTQLQQALAEKTTLAEQLDKTQANAAKLSDDLASVVRSLPPDPRGGRIEIRAAQFSASAGSLDYEVVLMRDAKPGKPVRRVMQLVVAGEAARGAPTTLAPDPIGFSLDSHEVLRGSLPLPEGFKPRQTTVQVLDAIGGKLLGMRVLFVR